MIWIGLLVGFLVATGFLSQPVYANFCAVNVTSIPSGAEIYIDGEYKGDAPVFHTFGNPTLADIAVKKEGYKEWRKLVDVPLDTIVYLEVELEPLKAQEAAPPVPTPAQEKASGRAICGPTLLLTLVVLPLGIRRLVKA